MIKRLWAVAGVALLGTAGVAGTLVVASPGGEEEALQQVETATSTASPTVSPAEASPSPTPSPSAASLSPSPSCAERVSPDSQLWRWQNLTIAVPIDSELSIGRRGLHTGEVPGETGAILTILRRSGGQVPGGDTEIYIDADDGRILREIVGEADRIVVEGIKRSICLEPQVDVSTLPWPYAQASPAESKVQHSANQIRYWEPDPGSGIVAIWGCGSSGGCFINLANGRSFIQIDAQTGDVNTTEADKLAPEDADAFRRWVEAVELPGS